MGLASLVRENFLVAFPLIIVWLWLTTDRFSLKKRVIITCFFIIGTSTVLGSTLVRNRIVGSDWVLVTCQGGQNFYIGNHQDNPRGIYRAPDFVRANPLFERDDFMAEARNRTGKTGMMPSELSSFWYGEAFKEIRSHPDLFVKRTLYKIILLFNFAEIPDNLNFYFFQKHFSTIMKLPMLTFGLVCPLGLLGLIFALFDKKGRLLAGFFVLYSVTLVMFFLFGRYRLALAPPLLIFGSYFIIRLWELLSNRNYRTFAIWLFALVVVIIFTHLPLKQSNLGASYSNLGTTYLRMGKIDKAIECFELALLKDPYNQNYLLDLGTVKFQAGDINGAVLALRTDQEANPDFIPAYLILGQIYYVQGDYEKALEQFQEAQRLDSLDITAYLGKALSLEAIGHYNKAIENYKMALDLDPENDLAINGMERINNKKNP
ncbi:MAG: tetratricopeptide repeat protein [bacterium]|nr:tetratricopeptide repeat protein [bacterium]